MLSITVLTQLLYVGAGEATSQGLGRVIWRVETVAYLVVALYSLRLARQHPIAAAGLLLAGLFNVMQLGMGLRMFGPVRAEGVPDGVGTAVVGMAFFLFFAGKFALGFSAVGLGSTVYRCAGGGVRWAGLAAMIAGVAAIGLCMLAMLMGEPRYTFPAGAAGTAAALLTAIALPLAYRSGAQPAAKADS